MLRFIIRLAIFFGVLLLMDRIVGKILTENRPIDYNLFLESKRDFFTKVNTTDILIIGDSHIADALDTRIINEQLGLDAYNLGIYHASPFENYFLTKAALQHLNSPPKAIVLGTNPVMFERPASAGKYTPLILPFPAKVALTHMSEEGFNINFFSRTLREKYLFPALFNRLKGVPYHPTREVEEVYLGHLKFFNQLSGTDWSAASPAYQGELNSIQVRYFERTIELAQAAGITVIIVHPPLWKNKMEALQTTQAYLNFEQTVSEIVSKYHVVQYPDSSTGTIIEGRTGLEQRHFLNAQHLNYHGSKKFTHEFTAVYPGMLSSD